MKEKFAEILTGLGFLELSTCTLITKDDLKNIGLKEKDAIQVEKSKSDFKILRPKLLPSMLSVISGNLNSEYPQKMFEMGTVFERNDKEETGIKEKQNLIMAITPGNFSEIKQILDYLSKMAAIEFKLEKNPNPNPNFIEGRVASIHVNNKNLGFIGEISPNVLKNYHLKMPLVLLEIDVDDLLT
jgi:phenylalanyl-tRNA synthetase beta chain